MKLAVLAALLFAGPAHAESELYLDVGLGHMWGSTVVEQTASKAWGDAETSQPAPSFQDASGPHAAIEAGYKFGHTSVFITHASSIATRQDDGVNFVGVKHRFSVNLK